MWNYISVVSRMVVFSINKFFSNFMSNKQIVIYIYIAMNGDDKI